MRVIITRGIIIVGLIFSYVSAETKSGTIKDANPEIFGLGIDFSALYEGEPPCTVPICDPPQDEENVDLKMSSSKMSAAMGVVDFGFVDSSFLDCENIPGDKSALYFDAIFFNKLFAAPLEGYKDSIPFSLSVSASVGICSGNSLLGHLLFIKTRENNYAALIITSYFLGALDHYNFYWVYQNDGSRDFSNSLNIDISTNKFLKKKSDIRITPNPFTSAGPLQIHTMDTDISIFNATGKKVKRLRGNNLLWDGIDDKVDWAILCYHVLRQNLLFPYG